MKRSIASRIPFYYGWCIVAISLITLIMAYGIWWSFSIFYVSLLQEFGWSRADTAIIFTIGSVIYGFCSFPAGYLADHLGPRRLIPAAVVMQATGCLICSVANEKWHFFVAYGVFMGIGTICMGFVPIATLLSNWFVERRGRALGIALMGQVAPPILAFPIQELISIVGWRMAFVILAFILTVVIVPLTGLFMRTRPQDLGLEPDGSPSPKNLATYSYKKPTKKVFQKIVDQHWVDTEWTLVKSLKTVRFWALAGVLFALGVGNGVIVNHFVAMLVDMGRSRELAAFVFGLTGLITATGRLFGFLSDRIGRELTFGFLSFLLICSAGSLLLFLGNAQISFVYLYALLFGFGYGLCSPTLSAGAADLFMGKRFGSILGFSNVAFGIGQGIGVWMGGAVFDLTGSYVRAVIFTIPIYALMGLSYWMMAPRKVRRIITHFPSSE